MKFLLLIPCNDSRGAHKGGIVLNHGDRDSLTSLTLRTSSSEAER